MTCFVGEMGLHYDNHERIMKEKIQFWLMVLLLVGLIGAGNTGLVDPVENNELHQEEVVLYNHEVNEWDVNIQIDEVCDCLLLHRHSFDSDFG